MTISAITSHADPTNPDTGKTSIYIVGVVHAKTKFRNADSLLLLLRDIRPDLILAETDTLTGMFRSDYSFVGLPKKYKPAKKNRLIKHFDPELAVLYRYVEEDTLVRIHPFDITIANRKNYTRQEHEWIEALEKAHRNGDIPKELDSTYNAYMKLFDLYTYMHSLTYRQMNRPSMTDSMRNNQALEEKLSKQLVDGAPALASYRDWQTLHFMNWKKRNEVMVENIIRFTTQTKARKVVVFTGLLHKPYLIDGLGSGPYRDQFELKEYFGQ